MSARDNNRNIHSMNEQVQFGRWQAQSSRASDVVIQLLLDKNKIEGENKPIDKEKQKSSRKSLESVRRINQVNEETKKSYDEHVAKTKQREKLFVIHC